MTLSETGLDFDALGQTAQVNATVLDQNDVPISATVTWSIADVSVATVSAGLVTAEGNGSTTLTAAVGVVSSTIGVDVDQEADTILLSTTDVQLQVGQDLLITADAQDSGGSPIPGAAILWNQDDASIATVSSGGLVTAEGVGVTTVTASADGALSTATVTVAAPAGPSEIVFTSLRDGDFEVYVMNEDGSAQTNLTAAPGSGEWSGMAEPGGGRVVVFVTDRDGDTEIYSLDRDAPTAPPENLTNDARQDRDPAWSWDASKIAFSRSDSIWVMDPNGGNQTALGVEGRHPTWSPDGSRIAYVAGPFTLNPDAQTAPGALYVMDADGSNPVNASPTSGSEDRAPEWSPDGTKIIFATRFMSGGTTLHTVEPDGSNLTPLVLSHPLGDGWPSWSPDGSRVAHASRDPNNTSDLEIWTKNPDGNSRTRITSVAGVDFMPKWIR